MRFFVTGTDTNVGKTEVSLALVHLLKSKGMQPWAYKPYETDWRSRARSDAFRLWNAAGRGQPWSSVCTYQLPAPLAPAMAAAKVGRRLSFARIVRHIRRCPVSASVVEGAGGLRVPVDLRHEVVDLIEALRYPVVLVARAGLGTLNHVGLSMDLLQRRRIRVAAIVLMKGNSRRDESVASNREHISKSHPTVWVPDVVPFVRAGSVRQRILQQMLAPLLQHPEEGTAARARWHR